MPLLTNTRETLALPIYALIGTSRHLGVGPEPGTEILAAAAAVQLADGDPVRYAALMATIAGLVGVVTLVAGIWVVPTINAAVLDYQRRTNSC